MLIYVKLWLNAVAKLVEAIRKNTRSIPEAVFEYFINLSLQQLCGPRVDSISNRNN